MNKILKEKIMESFSSVLPITALVLALSVLVVPMGVDTISMFLVGAVLLIIGMGLFQLGADMSMIPMGEGIGVQFSKTKKLWVVIGVSFVMGAIITIAEPDLQVLASQVPSIDRQALIFSVAGGVGIFLVIGILRTLFKINLSVLLIIFYSALFAVAIFVPGDFLSVAFDSGGVTTGPITVPFIMAMGVGLASTRSDKDASSDSFGLVALGSIGPVLAVMMLGIFYNPGNVDYTPVEIAHVSTTRDVALEFLHELPHYMKDVALAILPIVAVFLLFQLITRRYKRRQRIRMLVGFVYTFAGLVLFLTGVEVGFISVGHLLGSELAGSPYRWLLVPLGALIGYFMVSAEPAVHVLNKQVEDVTNGAIAQSAMSKCLSVGVAASVALSMLRVLTGISIFWIIVPGYILSITLTFFVPKIFVGIAFDSGGVASGPMATTFMLPLAMGACEALGGNVMTDAFGAVALVAMTPLIAVQVMGVVYSLKLKRAEHAATEQIIETDEIIEYENEEVLSDE